LLGAGLGAGAVLKLIIVPPVIVGLEGVGVTVVVPPDDPVLGGAGVGVGVDVDAGAGEGVAN